MTVLVLGASGATGKHLVEQLLNIGKTVKVMVRPSSQIPESWEKQNKISIIRANLSGLSVDDMSKHLADCQAVASCLGHNLTAKGIWGKPKYLVSDAVELACYAIRSNIPKTAIKFVLMNTSGNSNRDLKEKLSLGEKILLSLIRLLIPPQKDNEKAADTLRLSVGQNDKHIEWVAVRPDSLINQEYVSDYKAYPSPIRSTLFKPGKTSRINVGHFMSSLIVENDLWQKWKGKMPVLYNSDSIT